MNSSSVVSRSMRNRTLADYAAEKARETPDAVAVFLEHDEPIRFGSIYQEAMKLAVALRELGLVAGDVVSFQLPNWREAIAIDIAACWLGVVVNPIIPIYRDSEVAFSLGDCRSKLIFVPEIYRKYDYPGMLERIQSSLPDLQHVVVVRGSAQRDGHMTYQTLLAGSAGDAPSQVQVDADATKLIMYTSGTTGRAKAVRHSHNTLARSIDNGCAAWELGAGDVMLMPSPVTHITGYADGIELPFFTDCKVALMEQWQVDAAIHYIERVGATCCVSATPFLQELVDRAERDALTLPSLRFFACGGASVPPTLIHKAHRVLANCRAFRVYGCTEAPLVTVGFTGPGEEDLAATTDGKIWNWDVLVVDEEGQQLDLGMDGEILVKSPAMMLGYGDEEQTRQAVDAQGFFHTGDIGHITSAGAVVITDRKKDIIIRGGENLSAREIEDVLHRHDAISEAAVVSMPHARLGEGVCAYLIAHEGSALTMTDITEFLSRAGMAKQKWPERIEFVNELPKTPSGKVRKDVLRRSIKTAIENEL